MAGRKIKPLVSVIIPCFNMGEYIREAVESVTKQSYKDLEIIIVDDGSTDKNTINELKEIVSIDPKIRVIKQTNQKLPAARNNGIKEAKGKYIACLDADDKYRKDFLEKAVCVLEEDKSGEVGFVTTWAQQFGASNRQWETIDFDPVALLQKNVIHVASLFRRIAWEKVGGYNKKMIDGFEDWDFWLRLVEFGYSWKTIHEYLFYYRVRPNSMLSGAIKKYKGLYSNLVRDHEKLFLKYAQSVIQRQNFEIFEKDQKITGFYIELDEKNNFIKGVYDSRGWQILSKINALKKKKEIK